MIVRTASKMRAHLDDFSGNLSSGLSKPARRFVSEALYGIAARGSVRLAEIGRSLEETIPLIKTETRLSRNLGRAELRDHLGAAVLREAGARIGERTLLVLDLSDIAKPYAENLRQIAQAIKTSRQCPAPTHPRIRLEFLGNVLVIRLLIFARVSAYTYSPVYRHIFSCS